VAILDLTGNALRVNPSLLQQTSLQQLLLGNNNLTAVVGPLCANCTSLQLIDLSGNSLAAIAPTAFEGLDAAIVVDLNRNALTAIPAGTLAPLSRNLTTLFVSGNRLSAIPTDVRGLSGLQVLDISLNEIGPTLAPGSLPPNLRILLAYGNRLAAVQNHTFAGLPLLQRLCLWNNQITSVASDALQNATLLTDLHLFNNVLADLPPGGLRANLSELRQLTLFGNPLRRFDHDSFSGMSNINLVPVLPTGPLQHLATSYASLSAGWLTLVDVAAPPALEIPTYLVPSLGKRGLLCNSSQTRWSDCQFCPAGVVFVGCRGCNRIPARALACRLIRTCMLPLAPKHGAVILHVTCVLSCDLRRFSLVRLSYPPVFNRHHSLTQCRTVNLGPLPSFRHLCQYRGLWLPAVPPRRVLPGRCGRTRL